MNSHHNDTTPAVEHVVHATPPRILGADPTDTIMDSLCVMAVKQAEANGLATSAFSHRDIIRVMSSHL